LSGIFGANLYDFSAREIDGAQYDFAQLRGKVVIVANVASEWGLAKTHYPQLQQLYEEYRLDGLEVLAFPCNQFMGQEPGTNAEIKAKIGEKWAPSFQLMAKINVNGRAAHPLYKWMKSSTAGGGREIGWNFTNFLIDRCGNVRMRHEPRERPVQWEDHVRDLLEETDNCV